jgi:hypothetical protein
LHCEASRTPRKFARRGHAPAHESIRREAEQPIDFYTQADDQSGLGRAHFLMGCVDLRAGIATTAEASFRDSLLLADLWGDVRDRAAARWMIAEALVAGPKPIVTCFRQLDG